MSETALVDRRAESSGRAVNAEIQGTLFGAGPWLTVALDSDAKCRRETQELMGWHCGACTDSHPKQPASQRHGPQPHTDCAMSDTQVFSIGTDQKALVDGLTEILQMAKDGQLSSFSGAGVMRDGCVCVMRGGSWHKDIYTMAGGLDSVKSWVLRNDERLA